MSNSYRIRTQVGVDKSVQVYLDQDFEFLEILSLKILQSQLYTRPCADYGVVVGRISINNGFGLPNAKVSIFIPLSPDDEENPIISQLYPYKSTTVVSEDGYRYNLLPYVQSHGGHTPTGTFFDREDVLIDNTLIQVYDKYYKYTARTNDSGDFMIFGVPLGSQQLHVDVDLSDIGEFSLFPQDLIRMGRATESQVAGTRFKASTNLGELPQIISIDRTVQVEPLWGQEDFCNIGITRMDFDLSDGYNIKIEPTSIFMGSIISSNEDEPQKRNCKPALKQGSQCSLVTGPGEILAIRQTIFQDTEGRPGLEVYDLEQGGQVIDDNGTWLVDVPMNLDYIVTNEFGQQVLSADPNKGIPTKAKYRFKVKWNQSPTLREPVKRGYFLVPNIKENGWIYGNNTDPLKQPSSSQAFQEALKNYAFSIDWNDYGDTGTTLGQQMIQEAVSCEDKFYEFTYNKVYTVSQLVDQFRTGFFPNRIIAIKNIIDESCMSENVKFPTNDSNLRWDIVYLLFLILLYPMRIILYILVIVMHVLAFVVMILGPILAIIVGIIMVIILVICEIINAIIDGINSVANLLGFSINRLTCPTFDDISRTVDTMLNLWRVFTNIPLPSLTYPDCELCNCKIENLNDTPSSNPATAQATTAANNAGANSILSPYWESTRYIYFGGRANPSSIASMMAGTGMNNNFPTSYSRAPNYQVYGSNILFTTSIPIAERINLFNTKAKYFNPNTTLGPNPGGGTNRIKVTFNTDWNNPNTLFHYDNVLVMSFKEGKLGDFTAGQLYSFQDITQTKDKNLTGLTATNQFGTKSITGTSIGTVIGTGTSAYTKTNVAVPYAKFNGSGNDPGPTYVITGKTDDVNYHKFPIDVEYFQVITAMTYSSFLSIAGNTVQDTLKTRFLDNDIKFELTNPNGCWDLTNSASFLHKPLFTFKDGDKQVLVFFVRGVDPNSTRTKCRYDLSLLFGNNLGTSSNIFEGEYKLNIPVQGSLKNVSHTDFLLNAFLPTSTYSNTKLYYDSYHFQPATTGQGSFSSFTSNYPMYYSSLDASTSSGFQPSNPAPPPVNLLTNQTPRGLTLKSSYSNNGFTQSFATLFAKLDCVGPGICTTLQAVPNFTGLNTRGYMADEIVEGGSFLKQDMTYDTANFNPANCAGNYIYRGYYYSPAYSTSTNITYPVGLGASGRQIVMRSDRLPTSTVQELNAGNNHVLQSNTKFSIYKVSDDGSVISNAGSGLGTPTLGPNDNDQPESIDTSIFDSLTCAGLVPLECYETDSNGEISIKSKPNSCYENKVDGEEIMKGGCYILVTTVLLTLLNGRDFKLLTEWVNRLQITFGACRNVWSHLFTNNWINGTLYAFSFNNDRFFSPPNANPPNKPSSKYCQRTLILHPDNNNFYYRSSPYDNNSNEFIGVERPIDSVLSTSYGGNIRNLLFPTTIMDLGPKNLFIQELVMSDKYDGFVVSKLPQTTFSETSEILNIFILTRLLNTSFLQALFGGGGASIFSYFDKRTKLLVDADFAQSISVNSELGVAPFQAISYPKLPNPLQDPIFFNGGNTSDGLFGIFFSSDSQTRDWISPKRTIIVPSGLTSNLCTYNNYGAFSQRVPFYQWDIKNNSGGSSSPQPDSIFGSQNNNWHTDPTTSPSGAGFFSFRYQSMDRTDPNCRYFRPQNAGSQSFYKGYIYAVTNPGSTFANPDYDPSLNSTWNQNNPDPRKVTVGAPYHFYFGLKKGKTAWDRFARKWLDLENIETNG